MGRVERLTSLRGFAALFALMHHAQEMIGGFDLRPWTMLFAKGYLAVDFFFVLSGFILAYVYGREFDAGGGRYGRFLGNRLARMYPVHVVTLIAAVVTMVPLATFTRLPDPTQIPASIPYNLLLVHGWGFADSLTWNFPSWSISSEWFAYLAFPVLLFATRPFARRPLSALLLACASIVALALCVMLLARGVTVAGLTLKSAAAAEKPFDLTIKWSLLRVSLEFFAGLLLFRVYALGPKLSERTIDFGVAIGLGSLLVILHLPWGPSVVPDALAVISIGAVILLVSWSQGFTARVLENRPLIYLGEISYSIYMTHALVLMFCMRLHRVGLPETHDLVGGSVFFAAVLLVTLAASALSYELVEKPARAYLRRFLERPQVRPGVA